MALHLGFNLEITKKANKICRTKRKLIKKKTNLKLYIFYTYIFFVKCIIFFVQSLDSNFIKPSNHQKTAMGFTIKALRCGFLASSKCSETGSSVQSEALWTAGLLRNLQLLMVQKSLRSPRMMISSHYSQNGFIHPKRWLALPSTVGILDVPFLCNINRQVSEFHLHPAPKAG